MKHTDIAFVRWPDRSTRTQRITHLQAALGTPGGHTDTYRMPCGSSRLSAKAVRHCRAETDTHVLLENGSHNFVTPEGAS